MGAARRVVAKFSTNFLPISETFVYDEVTAHQRYAVEVLTLRRKNRDRFAPRVPIWSLADGPLGNVEANLCKLTTISPTFMWRCTRGLYDVMHAHFGTGGVYGLPYKLALGLPLVVTFHGHEVPLLQTRRRFEPKHWGYWALSRPLIRAADLLLPVSDAFIEPLLAMGAKKDRVRRFNLGTRVPDIPPPAPPRSESRFGREGVRSGPSPGGGRLGSLRVLMIGRFVEKKGFEYGIRALARAQALGVDANLTIIGDGPLLAFYERSVVALGLSQSVRFTGPLTHAEVSQALVHSDVLLAPSVVARNGDKEGAPTVIKEAGAHYVPVIASRHSGIPQQVDDGKTGFLVPEHDVEAIAQRLRQLQNNPTMRHRMGLAHRRFVEEHFELKRQVALLEDYYDDVIARGRRRS